MGAHLGKHTDTSFDNAKQLYEEGANTKPYAMLSLITPLQHPLANGINLAGLTPDGSNVLGTVFGNYPEGSTDIGFLYDGSASDCAVGASWNPKLMGCTLQFGLMFLCFSLRILLTCASLSCFLCRFDSQWRIGSGRV